jgi:hypothetical protein
LFLVYGEFAALEQAAERDKIKTPPSKYERRRFNQMKQLMAAC